VSAAASLDPPRPYSRPAAKIKGAVRAAVELLETSARPHGVRPSTTLRLAYATSVKKMKDPWCIRERRRSRVGGVNRDASAAGETPLVLVVDDESDLRLLLRIAFESCGHIVHEAQDGTEALEHVERELPDLVVTDVMMPHMNGIELAERLQARATPVPLIAISADRQKLAEVAADVKIEKPFDPQDLVAAARRLLTPA
jgi:CheY-like chemotaxis protein